MYHPNDSVRKLHGVGDVRAAALEKLGIRTLRDLLYDFPRAYENRGHIRRLAEGSDGVKSAFLLTVGTEPKTARLRSRMTLTKFKAFDESGTVDVVFYNQEYVRQLFHIGDTVRFWGKLTYKKGWSLNSPEFEMAPDGKLLPEFISTYSLNSNVSRKILEGLISSVLTMEIPDFLPEDIRLKYKFPTLSRALRGVHRPSSKEELSASLRRLVFDELFCMSLSVAVNRAQKRRPTSAPCHPVDMQPFFALLPYHLTNAQERSVQEFITDMTAGCTNSAPSMRRILIGDVGSGKTVCAMAAIFLAVKNGYQAALMAPTEILAHQHYHDLHDFFSRLGIECACLTGSTPKKEKNSIYARLAASPSDLPIIIGTHALLGNKVLFSNLGLTIADEQHRFGIRQRTTLDEKSDNGHLLVMSATPIPRTLALAIYGDLSISRLDEMPKGRQPVETFVVDESYRTRLNGFITKQVTEGGQVYIVCPAIDESDEPSDEVPLDNQIFSYVTGSPMKSAIAYARELREQVFPDFTVGLLHGKMKSDEKEAVMNSFVVGDIDILVSTTVIEVGVNVPNASLMIVEGAERFGLSQLHQLRGRVGRGNRRSFCVLVSDATSPEARKRLRVMASTNNGFEIAEEDLKMRGPGDFFSGACNSEMRQSGGIKLRLAKCCDDASLMDCAVQEANALIHRDPTLTLPEHLAIREELSYYFDSTDNEIS